MEDCEGMSGIIQQLVSKKLKEYDCLDTFCSGIGTMDKFIQNDFRLSVENHYCSAYGVWLGED
jgi:hypothetical protein